MTYSLSSKCAKNYCNRTVLVQVIAEDAVACFLRHRVVVEEGLHCVEASNT